MRAVSASGRRDPTPAHAAWTVDTVAPKVTLAASGQREHDERPHAGVLGNGRHRSDGFVENHGQGVLGAASSGSPVQTLTSTCRAATWSVPAARRWRTAPTPRRRSSLTSVGNTRHQHAQHVHDPGLRRRRLRAADSSAAGAAHASPPPTAPAPSTYSVGGTVSGLSDGAVVVLQDNGGDDLTVASNGSFTFATPLADGAAYSVTIAKHRAGEVCTLSGGSGTVASANVTSVAVTCVPSTTQLGADNFNRADGGLGAGWTAMTDGALSIASQQVVGTAGRTTRATFGAARELQQRPVLADRGDVELDRSRRRR